NRLLIQAEGRVERPHQLDVTDAAVGTHDALDENGSLDLGAHRIRRVLRLFFMQHARERNAVAGTIRAAARSAAVAFPKARSASRANARSLTGAGTATDARTLRQRRRPVRRFDQSRQ